MFKVIWDKDNNGVRLTMSSAGESLNVCPRPVFWEELDFLGLDKLGWKYPHSEAPLLWACDRRYFYKGDLVLEVKGGDLYDSHEIDFCEPRNLQLEPINIETLRNRNEDSMFLLEHEAMTFINSEYLKYKQATKAANNNPDVDFQKLAENLGKKTKTEHVVVKEDCDSFDIMPLSEAEMKGKSSLLKSKIDCFVVSFSGGKDSQVILDLVTRVIPSEDLVVIYSDTGYELPPSLSLYKRVESFYKEKYPNLKFYTSKNHQELMYYWDNMGSPSRMLRWCCSIMKSAPLSRLLKELHGGAKQPNAILFDGVRAEESVNRANRSRVGKNVKHNNIINVSPILEWNATETYLYILLQELPFNDAYRKGFSRVGCVICPYSSKWSENISSKIYPNSIKPFVDNIRQSLVESKVSGVDNYIKLGKWKERAGGRSIKCESSINFIEEGSDFKAVITRPREDIFMWLNILGEYRGEWDNSIYNGTLKYKGNIYRFQVERQGKDAYCFIMFETQFDVIFISYIKKVLYKATYCIHCEVCEVECPTGALSVVPYASIDTKKCVHCLKCIDFDGKGCLSASSVSISTGEKTNKMQSTKSGINRYNDGMGLREVWLRKYFSSYETFFDNDSHGLNPRYQIPPFINWIREAGILNETDKKISETGILLADNFSSKAIAVWEIIFINLCENSEVAKWYSSQVSFDKFLSKQELEIMIQNSYPDLKDRTLKNPLNSLLNTFKESPLGNVIPVGVAFSENKKSGVIRRHHNDLSLVATAYSLYKYAEKNKRYSMTVSEFYNEDQTEGIYRQFGTEQDVFEQNLRTLEQESNHVLRAELKMGLDNIILREDLTSLDILKLLL
jgi:3'-phosphoadenosine 5'-phosphosulfate sulfotransferase (PAPS reductase)/FAD synthetase/ferredoxin